VESGPRSQRSVLVPVGLPEQPAGFVELSAGADFSAEALETTRRAFFLAGGAAVVLAALLGWVMGRRISAPLLALTDTATRMSAGDFSVRAEVAGQDETGRLAGQFNQMAGQLQESFAQLAAERDSLRRFIADASHELRTPITALKNFNELLQGAAADDPQARAEFLAESQAQIERLEWITHNLLDLSRLDAGLAALDIHKHDLRDLIAAAAIPFRGLAAEKGIELAICTPGSPLEISADRARLEMALTNLLDNALKFTPPGGSVELGAQEQRSAEKAGPAARFWVRDTGPGISPDDLPHIFERFYRGRTAGRQGSGLGLSIVQSIVQAHGGSIQVESEPGAGARFIIEWPSCA
jgi:signal transduction histidine kinase